MKSAHFKQLTVLLAAFVFYFLPGLQVWAQPDGYRDTWGMEEIKEIGDKLAKAIVENDIDLLLSLYAEDAISLPNNGPRLDGVKALRKKHMEMADAGTTITSFESVPTDVWEAGSQVIEIGNYEFTLEMRSKARPIKERGKYLTIYERDVEGDLKIKVEIRNTDIDPMARRKGEREDDY